MRVVRKIHYNIFFMPYDAIKSLFGLMLIPALFKFPAIEVQASCQDRLLQSEILTDDLEN